MVTGEEGICEPVKNERGFSLPTRASQGAGYGAAAHGGANVPATATRMATAGAPAPPRRRAPPSRDLLITFKLGSSELTDQGRANARVFAQAMMLPDLAATRVELAGYTDASGDKDRNLALSQQRADSVKSFLVSQGVDGSRLESRGYGAQDFASPAHPTAPENRRVVASKIE
jgi:outer membrane protein OmpA-like peptidoglycan-associated protein